MIMIFLIIISGLLIIYSIINKNYNLYNSQNSKSDSSRAILYSGFVLPLGGVKKYNNENIIIKDKITITPYYGNSSCNSNSNSSNSVLEQGYKDLDNSSNIVDSNFNVIDMINITGKKLFLTYNHISSYLFDTFSYLGKGGYHLSKPKMNLPDVMSLPSDRFMCTSGVKTNNFSFNFPVFDTHNINISDYLMSIFNGYDHTLPVLLIIIMLSGFMTSFIAIILEFISNSIKYLSIITYSGYRKVNQIYRNLWNYQGSNGRWYTYNWYRTSMNESRHSYSGTGGDDGDDRKRRERYYKYSRLSPLPFLIRFMEILHQLLTRYFPIFTDALNRFEGLCRSLPNTVSLIGIMNVSNLRIPMGDFSLALSDFSIRIRETEIMVSTLLENIRRYIIDNISNSNLDEPFLVLERLLHRFSRASNIGIMNLFMPLIAEISRTLALSRNPRTFIEFLQNLVEPYENSFMLELRDAYDEIKTRLTSLYEFIRDLINRF